MKALLFALIACIGASFTSNAASLTLNPDADSFLSALTSGSNYGAAGALEVSATGSPKGGFDSVMKFNLGSAAGLSIQSISLQLVTASTVNAIFNSNTTGQFSVIWMQNSSWIEGTGTPMTSTTNGITYTTLPNYLGSSDETVGTFTSSAIVGATNSYTLNLTGGFLNAVTSGSEVSLEIVPDDSTVSYLFNSNNFTTPAARPLLTVTTVPEPAQLILVGTGLLALAGCRKYWFRRA